MSLLKYSDLTKDQREFICNGCGGKGGFINPPDFIFNASCNHHDFKYWLGKAEADFKIANKEFYQWMLFDIKLYAAWYLKPYYHTWALAYYAAVSIAGKKYFNFGSAYKTIVDLDNEIKKEVL